MTTQPAQPAKPARTFLHPLYGVIEYTGKSWAGHRDTVYGTFIDSTGQHINLPVATVSATLYREILQAW